MTTALETLRTKLLAENKAWAKAGGIVNGSRPVDITPWQQCCANHAGVYLSAAHEVELVIKNVKRTDHGTRNTSTL